MGIQLGSNFTMNAALPLDDRTTVADITARNAIAAGKRFEGLLVYVESVQTNYQLVGGILDANWSELSGSGGAADTTGKTTFTNNAINSITGIGDYLTDASCVIVDYYVFRRTDSSFKRMSGRIIIEGVTDAVLNADKWKIFESSRSEMDTTSGITFSLDDIDTEKSILVATLDNMAGANHSCSFYYKLTRLLNSTPVESLTNNSANNLTAIGSYLASARCLIIDYYIYRRTDSAFKTLSGKIFLEGVNDAVLNADKWKLYEMERSENLGVSGVTFSLSAIDTEKSILVATLDNMAGASHACTMYYKKTELLA
ncbi:MAG: hypothetical protein M3P98_03135 [bacterium]|nr:hypothetical protein [bacterium]